MSKFFDLIHTFTAHWEGGYVNHPSDPGGATNHGISLRFLQGAGIDINGDGVIDGRDIRALTPEAAREIYFREFWQNPGFEGLHPYIACAVYDTGVNVGVSRAVRFLQASCNEFQGPRLAEDGRLGPATIKAVETACATRQGAVILCNVFLIRREEFYYDLALQARFRPFYSGWIRRVEALRRYLANHAPEFFA